MSGTVPSSPVLRAVVLDAGPLGLLSNPKASAEGFACRAWIVHLTDADVRVIVPEITDYEVRRELIQARLTGSLRTLEQLVGTLDYLPLDTVMMRQAAQFWAQARQAGRPTADQHALDGDVILAAQTVSLGFRPEEVVVATANIGHLGQFVVARPWQEIQPSRTADVDE